MEIYPLRSTEVMDIERQPIITTLQNQHNPSLHSLHLTLCQHIHLTFNSHQEKLMMQHMENITKCYNQT